MSATETTLGSLHRKLAEAYERELASGELSPALLTSVAKFLKDNGITCEVGDQDMQKLAEKAGNVLDFPFDAKEASG